MTVWGGAVWAVGKLLFTADIPRDVFCEWSKAEVTENPSLGAPKCDYGAFCVHHVTMSGRE